MRVLLVLLLLFSTLAGCLSDPSQPLPPTDALTLRAGGVPLDVVAGQPVDLEVSVDGPSRSRSHHVDIHLGPEPAQPPSEGYPESCAQAQGDLPGTFTLRCVFSEPGRVHLRAHAQLEGEDGVRDYWGPDQELYVQPAEEPSYELRLDGLPPNATVGQPFPLGLVIGAANGTAATLEASVIEVRLANASNQEGSLSHYRRTCDGGPGTVPGTHGMNCSLPSQGPWFLRGHVRMLVNGDTVDYWTPERAVQADPLVPPSYTVSVTEVPTEAEAGQPFNVTVRVQGQPDRQAQRIDVRHGSSSQQNGSHDGYPEVCDAGPGAIPGEVTLSCTVDGTGERFLRGHMLLRVGDKLVPYWSPEVSVMVR